MKARWLIAFALMTGAWIPSGWGFDPFARRWDSRYSFSLPALNTGLSSLPLGLSKGETYAPLLIGGLWKMEPDFEHDYGVYLSADLGFIPGRNAYPFFDLRAQGKIKPTDALSIKLGVGALSKDAFTQGPYRVSDHSRFPPAWNQWLVGLNADYEWDWHRFKLELTRFFWLDERVAEADGLSTVVGGASNTKLGFTFERKREPASWDWEFGIDAFFLGTILVASPDFAIPISSRTVWRFTLGAGYPIRDRLALVARYAYVALPQASEQSTLPFQAPYYNRDYLLSAHSLRLEAVWDF